MAISHQEKSHSAQRNNQIRSLAKDLVRPKTGTGFLPLKSFPEHPLDNPQTHLTDFAQTSQVSLSNSDPVWLTRPQECIAVLL